MTDLYDDDPIQAAEEATADWVIERTLNEVLTAMVAVHAEFVAGDNAEARRLLANIHAGLATYPPDLLARCVTDLLDGQAHREAKAMAEAFDEFFALHYGDTITPKQIAAIELGICPDPDGHDRLYRSSETTWWERAKGIVRRDDGTCPYCGRRKP